MKKTKEIDIRHLRNEVNHLCLTDKIDFYDGNSLEEKICKCIDSEFKSLIDMYRSNNNKFDEIIKDALLAGPSFRKRKKVIKEYAINADKLYRDKYPNLCIYTEFSKYMCEPFYCIYDKLDNDEFIIEAASIYLLDELANYSLEEKAFKYMPKDEDIISMANIHPDAEDCLFSTELIQSMCYLFQNQTKVEKKEEAHLLTRELANSEKFELIGIDNPTTNKEKLINILSLLPNGIIDKVVNNFINDMWRLVDLVFYIENEYEKEFDDYKNEVDDLLNKFDKEIKNSNTVFANKDKSLIQMAIYSSRTEELVHILEDILNAKHLLRMGTSFMHFDNTILDDEIEEEYAKKLYDFEISNPYETCFAFMYLLTTNSDIVWLVSPCLTLLKLACLKLPWTKDFNIAKESNPNEEELHKKKMEEIKALISSNDCTDEDIYEDNDRIYKLKYTDAYEWYDYHNAKENEFLKLNFTQFCYNFSNRIPPRYVIQHSSKNIDGYLASGFSNEEIEMMDLFYYLIEGSGEKISFEKDIDVFINEERYLDKIDELNKNNSIKNKKIEILVKRIKNLQDALNSLKKEFKNYKNEYYNDTEEIYRLRELVYKLQNEKYVKETETTKYVELPYYSSKKAVILGGSDVWINKMKDSINNVSFLSSKQRINIDVLKNAEIIWIQIIELSHSDFYAVSNYAKTHHLPINYFLYSNIDKCINQFIETDNENKQ